MAVKKIDMKSIIGEVLSRKFSAGEEDFTVAANEIERRLQAAGFTQVDPFLLCFLDQLSAGLKDFIKSLVRIQNHIYFFKYPMERADSILRLIEHGKKTLSETEGGGTDADKA